MPENSVRSLSEYMTLMNSSNLPQFASLHPDHGGPGDCGELSGGPFEHAHHGDGAHTRDRHSQSPRFFSAGRRSRCCWVRLSILASMGNRFGNSAYFRDSGDFEADQSRPDHSDFPGVAFSPQPRLHCWGPQAEAVYPALRAASYDPVRRSGLRVVFNRLGTAVARAFFRVQTSA